tara:strand:+ start:369 stop:548 length:180 start_codon:yes stop_codon:yes gene_type:complete
MNKSSIIIFVYVIGIILGAVILDVWSAETSLLKAFTGVVWTVFFVIALFFADKKEKDNE